MKENKTEKPTQKKRRDSAKKGHMVKSRDITSTVHLTIVVLYLVYFFEGVDKIIYFLLFTTENFNALVAQKWLLSLMMIEIKIMLPLVIISILASIIPSLVQSRFTLVEIPVKLDFSRMNPIQGLKRIFSLRSITGTFKSLLYVSAVTIIGWVCYSKLLRILLTGVNGSLLMLIALFEKIFAISIFAILLCCGLLALVDYMIEYFHYFSEQMMTRQEVKKESSEQNGKPEIKHKRRQLHQEILNEDLKQNVRESQILLANPTHIVIGIYFNLTLSSYPFVSLVHTDAMARAVLAYANEIGKIVYRDERLVRSMYKSVKPYSFLHWSWFEALLMVLHWMEDIEQQYIQPEEIVEDDNLK